MSDWQVSIPLSDLQRLLASADRMETLEAKVSQLEREVLGLRQIQSDILQYFADIKYQTGKA